MRKWNLFTTNEIKPKGWLKKQLEMPELQTINPILVGELKAIDMVIDEFVQLFELYEFTEGKVEVKETEVMHDSLLDIKEE